MKRVIVDHGLEDPLYTVRSAVSILVVFCPWGLLWCQPAAPAKQSHRSEIQIQLAGKAASAPSEPASSLQPDCRAALSEKVEATPTLPDAPTPNHQRKSKSHLKQSDRILGIVPNFSSVSADTRLPPLTTHGKFILARNDSLDYSSFILTGILAAKDLGLDSDPELGGGAAGYGRYYWREFVDQLSGTYFTEAIIPALTHEDPRYYTLGGRGLFRRTGYALSRVFITRTDSGGEGFNYSEVVGDLLEAGLSNAYYPPQERGLHQTTTNWATQMLVTGGANMLKEFWPEIRHDLLRQR